MAKKEITQHLFEIAQLNTWLSPLQKNHMKIKICCDNKYTQIMKSTFFARQIEVLI